MSSTPKGQKSPRKKKSLQWSENVSIRADDDDRGGESSVLSPSGSPRRRRRFTKSVETFNASHTNRSEDSADKSSSRSPKRFSWPAKQVKIRDDKPTNFVPNQPNDRQPSKALTSEKEDTGTDRSSVKSPKRFSSSAKQVKTTENVPNQFLSFIQMNGGLAAETEWHSPDSNKASTVIPPNNLGKDAPPRSNGQETKHSTSKDSKAISTTIPSALPKSPKRATTKKKDLSSIPEKAVSPKATSKTASKKTAKCHTSQDAKPVASMPPASQGQNPSVRKKSHSPKQSTKNKDTAVPSPKHSAQDKDTAAPTSKKSGLPKANDSDSKKPISSTIPHVLPGKVRKPKTKSKSKSPKGRKRTRPPAPVAEESLASKPSASSESSMRYLPRKDVSRAPVAQESFASRPSASSESSIRYVARSDGSRAPVAGESYVSNPSVSTESPLRYLHGDEISASSSSSFYTMLSSVDVDRTSVSTGKITQDSLSKKYEKIEKAMARWKIERKETFSETPTGEATVTEGTPQEKSASQQLPVTQPNVSGSQSVGLNTLPTWAQTMVVDFDDSARTPTALVSPPFVKRQSELGQESFTEGTPQDKSKRQPNGSGSYSADLNTLPTWAETMIVDFNFSAPTPTDLVPPPFVKRQSKLGQEDEGMMRIPSTLPKKPSTSEAMAEGVTVVSSLTSHKGFVEVVLDEPSERESRRAPWPNQLQKAPHEEESDTDIEKVELVLSQSSKRVPRAATWPTQLQQVSQEEESDNDKYNEKVELVLSESSKSYSRSATWPNQLKQSADKKKESENPPHPALQTRNLSTLPRWMEQMIGPGWKEDLIGKESDRSRFQLEENIEMARVPTPSLPKHSSTNEGSDDEETCQVKTLKKVPGWMEDMMKNKSSEASEFQEKIELTRVPTIEYPSSPAMQSSNSFDTIDAIIPVYDGDILESIVDISSPTSEGKLRKVSKYRRMVERTLCCFCILVIVVMAVCAGSLFLHYSKERRIDSTSVVAHQDNTTGTSHPSNTPSRLPSEVPTVSPSRLPSEAPTVSPTELPSLMPTGLPSLMPTETPSLMPSETPTLQPTYTPFVLEDLPTETVVAILEDPESAQAKAFAWIQEDPKTLFGLIPRQRIFQKFSLATIYFATNGTAWENTMDWLNHTVHECNWFSSAGSYGWPVCHDDLTYKSLALATNGLRGSIPFEISILSSLHHVHVGGNRLEGAVSELVGKLKELRTLHLFENNLTGAIPSSIGRLSVIEEMDFQANKFVGSIPSEVGLLHGLKRLDWSKNGIAHTLPSEIGKLSKMESLSLVHNSLTGPVPSQFGVLQSLISLRLSNNDLEGELPTEIGQLASLEELWAFNNQLHGRIPSEYGLLGNLRELNLIVNWLSKTLPIELGFLTKLQSLHLSYNSFSGTIPPELGNLRLLSHLFIDSNSMTGEMPTTFGHLTQLEIINLNSNWLTGGLPTEIGSLSNLTQIDLDFNELDKSLPTEIGRLQNLELLDCNHNHITGAIPSEMGQMTELRRLQLSFNGLESELPSQMGWLQHLEKFLLADNLLTSSIPSQFGQLLSIEGLDIAGNALTGAIPSQIGLLSTLNEFLLEVNLLTSSIPPEIGMLEQLELLVAWENQFTGRLPTEIGLLSNARVFDVSLNKGLHGQIPTEVGKMGDARAIRFSTTSLEGTIPTELSALSNLTKLSLDKTSLEGSIAPELCERLEVLTMTCSAVLCGCACPCS